MWAVFSPVPKFEIDAAEAAALKQMLTGLAAPTGSQVIMGKKSGHYPFSTHRC